MANGQSSIQGVSKSRNAKLPLIGWLLLAALNWGFCLRAGRTTSGLDFSAFYAGVKVYRSHPQRLYDRHLQAQIEQTIPGATILYYNHPPYELWAWMPVAGLPFATAFWVWRAISVVLLAFAALLLSKTIGQHRGFWLTFATAAAFFPVGFCLLEGQDSTLLLLLFSAALYFLQRKREAASGAVLALGLFKLQFVLPIAAVFLLWRRWRFLAGFGCGALGVLATSLLMVGYSGLRNLLFLIVGVESTGDQGVTIGQMSNLRGLVYLLVGSHPGWINPIVLCISALLLWWAARSRNLETVQAFACLICFATLVSFHANQHDLTILIIPMLLAIGNQMWKSKDGWKVMIPIMLLFETPLYLIAGGRVASGLLAIAVVWLWYGLEVNFCRPHTASA
jgi:hypothetical protein